ncbi:MAG: trigger factor [Candidatus Pacebacteria bacterium]|nr:trigger factor [Candidatus Paceibacterota bacterium]
MKNTYTNLKKLSDKNGEIEFQAEIGMEELEVYSLKELSHYAAELALPGFRKGKVPDNLVREHIGEMELLEGAANEALRDAMQEIVTDESLAVLGRPELTITKIAPKNPLEFKIRFALAPEISLPDYRKIGRTVSEIKEELATTDKEIDEAIARIREMIAGVNAPEGEKKELPPLTDEDVKKFGPFENVAAFRAEIARNLGQEKASLAKDRKREEMIKQIVAHTKAKIPPMLVEQEFHEFLGDRDRRIEEAGLSLEEYLKTTGKTAEALDKEERALIEEDIKTSLVIQEIRKKEELAPSERDIQIAIAHLKMRYPERDEVSLRRTAEAMGLQEQLFAMLEEGKKEEREEAKKESEDKEEEKAE